MVPGVANLENSLFWCGMTLFPSFFSRRPKGRPIGYLGIKFDENRSVNKNFMVPGVVKNGKFTFWGWMTLNSKFFDGAMRDDP